MALHLTKDFGLWAAIITHVGDADVLPRCLQSLSKAGVRAVVIDTTKDGPSDAIKFICLKHGAVVDYDRWTDHFADSRNASLTLARKQEGAKFALQIDSDETLVIGDEALATKVLKGMVEGGAHILSIPMDSEDRYGTRRYMLQRIFTLDHEDAHFRGAIHERIKLATTHGITVLDASVDPGIREPLILMHDGHLDETAAEKKKHERNQACALNELSKNPVDPYVLSSIAVCLLGSHVEEAIDAFMKTLTICEKIRFEVCADVHFSILYNLMRFPEFLISLSKTTEAWNVLNRIRRLAPDLRELVSLQASILVQECNEPTAIELLHQNLVYRGHKSSLPGCCGWRDMHMLACAYFQILDFDRALSFLALAWESADSPAAKLMIEDRMRDLLPTIGLTAIISQGKVKIEGTITLPPVPIRPERRAMAVLKTADHPTPSDRLSNAINQIMPKKAGG